MPAENAKSDVILPRVSSERAIRAHAARAMLALTICGMMTVIGAAELSANRKTPAGSNVLATVIEEPAGEAVQTESTLSDGDEHVSQPDSYLEWLRSREAHSVEAIDEFQSVETLTYESDFAPSFESRLHVDLSLDWTTAYYFRGLLRERDGFIVQPALEFAIDLNETDAPLSTRFVGGVWNSVHDKATDARTSDDIREHWYESRLYGGLAVTSERLTLQALYIAYTSPSDAFDTVQELEFALMFDDRDMWEADITLNPEARLAFELGSNAADGQDRGAYLQLGVAPSFAWYVTSKTEIEISVPVTVGLSLDDYYQDANGSDDTFGFLDVGVEAAIDLPHPPSCGAWTLNAGVHWLMLGDHASEFAGGRDDEIIGTLGVNVSF